MTRIKILLLSLLFFFIPCIAHGAIVVGTYTTYSGAAATSHTFSHTVAAGVDCLIVRGSVNIAVLPTTVTFNGDAMTLASYATANSGADKYAWIYYLVNPDITTGDVVISLSGSGRTAATATSLTGCNTSSPLGSTASSTDGGIIGTTPSVNITTSFANSLLVDSVLNANKARTFTATGANQTLQGQVAILDPSGTGTVYSYETTTAAGAYTISYSIDLSDTSYIAVAEIKAVAAAAIPTLDEGDGGYVYDE